jgi:hypothetical protein
VDEAGEMACAPGVARGQSPEGLEAIAASLDAVSVLGDVDGVSERERAAALGRDHRLGLQGGDTLTQVGAVLGFVGAHGTGLLAL